MRYLIDTTFVIDHLRGDPAARELMARLAESGDQLYVNEVVVAEAWAGAHSDDDADLQALLDLVEFVQPAPVHARRAGRWRANARSRGWTLSMTDALIASAADSLDASLLTRNQRDFARTPIRVATY
ncbi:MAG TPA: PIN domain-containing protein [Candidatus Limnocylindrales bacterium]